MPVVLPPVAVVLSPVLAAPPVPVVLALLLLLLDAVPPLLLDAALVELMPTALPLLAAPVEAGPPPVVLGAPVVEGVPVVDATPFDPAVPLPLLDGVLEPPSVSEQAAASDRQARTQEEREIGNKARSMVLSLPPEPSRKEGRLFSPQGYQFSSSNGVGRAPADPSRVSLR